MRLQKYYYMLLLMLLLLFVGGRGQEEMIEARTGKIKPKTTDLLLSP